MSAAPVITSVEEARELGVDATAARHALWRAGDLSYLLHAGQIEALDAIGRSKHRRFVVNVGRRWGKSRLVCVIAAWLIALRILFRAGATPDELTDAPAWLMRSAFRTKSKARVLYAAPTHDMIEEFIAPHMDLLAEHAPPEMRPELYKGDYAFPDGDRIVMKGCEDRAKANRLRGPEADMAIVDEGGFIPILGYVVKSAIGFQLAETRGRLLMPSTPPESPDHPYVDFVAEAEERGAYYHATTEDAPHITPEMIEEIVEECGGRDTVTYQREAEAKLVRDPAIVVLPEFGDHLVGEHPRPAYFLPHIVGDMGFTDMTVLAFGYYDFEADLYVIEDEVAGQRMVSDVLDAEVRATEARLWPGLEVHRRRLDGTARERADLGREEWQQPVEEREGGDAGADRAWLAVSRDGKGGERQIGRMKALANRARIVCKRRRLIVHPRCTTIIAHMKHARWNPARTELVRVTDENGEPVHHYDGCAAGLYFVREVDTLTNPFPKPEPTTIDRFRAHRLEKSETSKLRGIFRRSAR